MAKRLFILIITCCIFISLSLIVAVGHMGFAGHIGQVISEFGFRVFGIFAVILPIALTILFVLYYYHNGFDRSKWQKFYGGLLLFCVFMLFQAIWFDSGELGIMIAIPLKKEIGYFGIYILSILILIIAWLLFSVDHFVKSIRYFGIFCFKIFKDSLARLNHFCVWIYDFTHQKHQNIKKKREQKEAEQYYDFDPDPPVPFTQIPDISDAQIKTFYVDESESKEEEEESEVNLIKIVEKDETIKQKDYSQKVLQRNKKFFMQLADNETQDKETKKSISLIKIKKTIKPDQPSDQPKEEQEEDVKNQVALVENKECIKREDGSDLQKEEALQENQEIPEHENKTLKDVSLIQKKSKTILAKELSENVQLLESLDKGEILKPRDYKLPSIDLLGKNPDKVQEIDEGELDEKIQNLLDKLNIFKIDGDVIRTYSGPLISTFEFKPASNIKVRSILNLSSDLAMALSAPTIRIQAPIPGKDVVGIEIPNSKIQTIYMREILESDVFQKSASPLTLALGKDIVGNPFVTDLKKLPHLLVAGTTGSGKSVAINAMIVSLLYRNSPDSLKLIMVDPKMVEFSMYEDIPHLLTPIITDPKKAIEALNSATREMERRYKLMSQAKVKTIESFNEKCKKTGEESFFYLVIIIDELADLMMTGGKEAEFPITRIAQMGRACGIHFIVATQRPSADVVTGMIKTNLPARIALRVGSALDSRVILDTDGAQSLLGRGDMLFTPPGQAGVIRLHAPWTSEKEIENIVDHIRSQRDPEYDDNFIIEENEIKQMQEPLSASDLSDLERAKEIIKTERKTSISFVQRRMNIGYNKAANIIENLEKEGFLSPPNSKGAREILQ